MFTQVRMGTTYICVNKGLQELMPRKDDTGTRILMLCCKVQGIKYNILRENAMKIY